MPITAQACAKLNLTLRVHGKRADGFHELTSLVCFTEDVADEIEITPAADIALSVEGAFGDALGATLSAPSDNLALRAAVLLRDACGEGRGAHIRLVKNIPVAAGLGGGSADAACVLRLLAQAWDVPALPEIAAQLGADVPACVLSRPLVMRGLGEKITPVDDFPPLSAVLVAPPVRLLTEDVYAALNAHALPSSFAPQDAGAWETTGNDLEVAASRLAPVIADVLEALRATQPLKAAMSGSGPACFAIYDSKDKAKKAAERLASAHAAWWVRASRLAA